MPGTVNGWTVAYAAVGGLVLWSGIAGTSISATLKGALAGKSPSQLPSTEAIGAPAAAGTAPAPAASSVPASGSYTVAELEALWTGQGGSSSTAFEAAQVAMAESSGDPWRTSPNSDGGTNVGLWQLDTRGVGSGYSVAQLQDPALNASLTVLHSANGTRWTYWADSVVSNGVYTGPKG